MRYYCSKLYGLVLLYGYGAEFCFGIGGEGTGYCRKRSPTLIPFDEQAQQQDQLLAG